MDRSTALIALLAVVGLSLFAAPLAFPAEEPSDRVEYQILQELDDSLDPDLTYDDLSAEERAVFDAALESRLEPHRVSPGESPDRFATDSVASFVVEKDDTAWAMRVVYVNTSPGLGQLVPRLVSLSLGITLVTLAAFFRIN